MYTNVAQFSNDFLRDHFKTEDGARWNVPGSPHTENGRRRVLAVDRELRFDRARMNVNGGAIALGHPIGCTGARIVVTLLHEMERSKARKGLATLCVSGGMGGALLLERVD